MNQQADSPLRLPTRLQTGRQRSLFAAVALAALALIVRGPLVGDVLPHVDDQFYLLVADRLWRGELPFVDVWDRKPIGLFLLYAAFRPFGTYGIVAYQVAAGIFATATAYTISCIGRRIGRPDAALLAAALYLIYLPCVGGNSGQSPVFYNLAMAVAALLLVRAAEQNDRRAIVPAGAAALLLVGIAIQIKYTAAIEGCCFGIFFLWLCRRREMPFVHIALAATLLVVLALLPTALAFAFYAAQGYGAIFIQSNFFSIFQTDNNGIDATSHLEATSIKMAALLFAVLAAISYVTIRRAWTPLYFIVLCWSVVAVIGFAAIGRFYGHYALPALVPFTLMLVPLLEVPLAAVGVTIACIGFSSLFLLPSIETKSDREFYVTRLTTILQPYAQRGCLYLKDGPTIVYMTTHSCLPTRYVFPEHLTTLLEAKAADATIEMRKLLAKRPAAITVSTKDTDRAANVDTQGMLEDALKSDYVFLTSVPLPSNGFGNEANDVQKIYVRQDLTSSASRKRP